MHPSTGACLENLATSSDMSRSDRDAFMIYGDSTSIIPPMFCPPFSIFGSSSPGQAFDPSRW